MTEDGRSSWQGTEWLARGLGMAVATIPILLALDVFGQGERGSLIEVGMIHVALSVPLILALLVGWVRPRWGAAVYVVLGLAYGAALMILALLFWLAGATRAAP